MRASRIAAALIALALAACEQSTEPQQTWLRASVIAAEGADAVEGDFHGTGAFSNGERRPFAPLPFAIHSVELGAASPRQVQIRAPRQPAAGVYGVGSADDELRALYIVPGPHGMAVYQADTGTIDIETATAGHTTGSFRFEASLARTCEGTANRISCTVSPDPAQRIVVEGRFDARYSSAAPLAL